jgi:hypothetical protein
MPVPRMVTRTMRVSEVRFAWLVFREEDKRRSLAALFGEEVRISGEKID